MSEVSKNWKAACKRYFDKFMKMTPEQRLNEYYTNFSNPLRTSKRFAYTLPVDAFKKLYLALVEILTVKDKQHPEQLPNITLPQWCVAQYFKPKYADFYDKLEDRKLDAFFIEPEPELYAKYWGIPHAAMLDTLNFVVNPYNANYFKFHKWAPYYIQPTIEISHTNQTENQNTYNIDIKMPVYGPTELFSTFPPHVLAHYININKMYHQYVLTYILSRFGPQYFYTSLRLTHFQENTALDGVFTRRYFVNKSGNTSAEVFINENLCIGEVYHVKPAEVKLNGKHNYERVSYEEYDPDNEKIKSVNMFTPDSIGKIYVDVPVSGWADDDNECFYNCLAQILPNQEIKGRQAGGVSLDDINKILRVNNFYTHYSKLIVYDQDYNELRVYQKSSPGTKPCPHSIMFNFNDNHYTVIKKGSLKGKTKCPRYICSYDFETIIVDGIVRPFSVCMVLYKYSDICNPNIKLAPIDTCMVKFSREEEFDPIGTLLDQICEWHRVYCKPIELTGWNTSNFDFHIIYDRLLSDPRFTVDSKQTIKVGNGMLFCKTNKCTFSDMNRVIVGSLSKACEAFKVGSAKKVLTISFDDIQRYYEGSQKLTADNLNEFYEYNLYDCLAVGEIIQKFIASVCSIFKLNETRRATFFANMFRKYYTAGGLAIDFAKYMCGSLQHAFKSVSEIYDIQFYNQMRQSVYAGRVSPKYEQPTNFGEIFAVMIDIVSSYPTQMSHERFPVGLPTHTNTYATGKIGFYNVDIISQPLEYTIIPRRVEGEPLDFNYRGPMSVYISSVDIEELKKYNCEFVIKDGIYFEEDTTDMFKNYIDCLITEKSKHDYFKLLIDSYPKDSAEYKEGNNNYNPALREICKLLMNSVSGKCIEQPHTDFYGIVRDNQPHPKIDHIRQHEQFNGFTILIGSHDLTKEHIKAPIHIGSLIYAYARRHLYNALQYGSLTCDTDSAIFHGRDFARFAHNNVGLIAQSVNLKKILNNAYDFYCARGELVDGDEELFTCPADFKYNPMQIKQLGEWDCEYSGPARCYVVAKKVYALFGEKSKYRLKGCSKSATYSGTSIRLVDNPEMYYKMRCQNNKVAFDTFQFIKCLNPIKRDGVTYQNTLVHKNITKFV